MSQFRRRGVCWRKCPAHLVETLACITPNPWPPNNSDLSQVDYGATFGDWCRKVCTRHSASVVLSG